jgi:hypothetical protein
MLAWTLRSDRLPVQHKLNDFLEINEIPFQRLKTILFRIIWPEPAEDFAMMTNLRIRIKYESVCGQPFSCLIFRRHEFTLRCEFRDLIFHRFNLAAFEFPDFLRKFTSLDDYDIWPEST